jgi:hypothetical protein
LLNLLAQLKYIDYDSRVLSVPIGYNRGKGQPTKTKGALDYQADEQRVYSGDLDLDITFGTQKAKLKGRKQKRKIDDDASSESDFDIFNEEEVKSVKKSLKKQNEIVHSNEKSVIDQENLANLDRISPTSTDASSNSVSTKPKGSIVEVASEPGSSFC